jgi:hypothetical protein
MLGASSGGAFIGMLSNFLRLNDRGFQVSGIIPQIMPIIGTGQSPITYPPVAFVHMERDQHTTRNIEREIKLLNTNHIPCKSFDVTSKPVHKDYFFQSSILTANESETRRSLQERGDCRRGIHANRRP